jgi:hypothetical protein
LNEKAFCPSAVRRRNASEAPMRTPLGLSSASGTRRRWAQSLSAAAWISGAASAPGKAFSSRSAQAPSRSLTTCSVLERSWSSVRWTIQPEPKANSSRTTTTVA